MRVLFVLSTLLGNNVYSSQLVDIVNDEFKDIDPCFLYYRQSDYKKHIKNKLEFYISKFVSYENEFISENADILNMNYDIVIIQSFDLMNGLHDLMKGVPVIVAHDTTNVLSNSLERRLKNSKVYNLVSKVQTFFTKRKYCHLLKEVDFFLPRTNWAAESLCKDYSISENKIAVTPGYLDLDMWVPSGRKQKRILFVGNDFKMKGGDFLIDIYINYLSKYCDLLIVSNDRSIEKSSLPKGVSLVSGLSPENKQQLISIYQESDVFVFPTYIDKLGLVLREACATGLPIVARNVGGASDLVHNNKNGFLMDFYASPSAWGEKILNILRDDSLAQRMGGKSRELAENYLSKDKYVESLRCALSGALLSSRN